MIKQLLILTSFLIFTFSMFAQVQPTGALTIFSEDGDKFFLVLNGEKQNNIAQTNLRIEDLPQPYYTVKIIFENNTLTEISKKNLMLTDVDGIFQDVTYKIKHDKTGMPKMSSLPYSSIPITQGYVAPSNVYVMHYGAPVAAVSQTTTTTTTIGTPGTNVNINMAGINVGMTVSDPFQTQITETTTTTTSTGVNHNTISANTNCSNGFSMLPGDFSSAVATIKKQSFDDTKLSTAKQITSSNCLSAAQITDICKLLGFEQSKLDYAKFAFRFCTDAKNYFKVNNVFQFSTSVDELNEYTQDH